MSEVAPDTTLREPPPCSGVSKDGKVCTLPVGHGGLCAERERIDRKNGTATWRTICRWKPGETSAPFKSIASG